MKTNWVEVEEVMCIASGDTTSNVIKTLTYFVYELVENSIDHAIWQPAELAWGESNPLQISKGTGIYED